MCRGTRSHLKDPFSVIRSFLDTLLLYTASTSHDCPSRFVKFKSGNETKNLQARH